MALFRRRCKKAKWCHPDDTEQGDSASLMVPVAQRSNNKGIRARAPSSSVGQGQNRAAGTRCFSPEPYRLGLHVSINYRGVLCVIYITAHS